MCSKTSKQWNIGWAHGTSHDHPPDADYRWTSAEKDEYRAGFQAGRDYKLRREGKIK